MIRVRMTSQVHRWNNLDYLLSNHVRKTVQGRLCITDDSLLRTVLFCIPSASKADLQLGAFHDTRRHTENGRIAGSLLWSNVRYRFGIGARPSARTTESQDRQSCRARGNLGTSEKPQDRYRILIEIPAELPWTSNDVQLQRRHEDTHTRPRLRRDPGRMGENDTQLLNTLRQSEAKLTIFQARECVTPRQDWDATRWDVLRETNKNTQTNVPKRRGQEKRVVNIVKHMLQSTTDVNVSTLSASEREEMNVSIHLLQSTKTEKRRIN